MRYERDGSIARIVLNWPERANAQSSEMVHQVDACLDEARQDYEVKVVIVKGNPNLSKIYYKKQYSSGDDAPPDCYSLDGVKPELDSPERQAEACIGCQWNNSAPPSQNTPSQQIASHGR